ncbi:50S ribosomal protein L13, chloroplastic-like protein isoform X2 [Tanacetum coccineum]
MYHALSISVKKEAYVGSFRLSLLYSIDVRNKTWYPKAKAHVNTEKTWYVVDETDKILGRLASTIAIHIRGKNLATYTPSVDMRAFVVVVNADKVVVLGKKRIQKLYRMHSGRPSGMTVETFDQLQQRIPERIVEHATIWQDSNTLVEFRRISLTGFRSCTSRSQYRNVSKQTTRNE